jgi:hypothetical protein
MKSSLKNQTIMKHSFSDCPRGCCNSTEFLKISNNQSLIMITDKAVYGYTIEGCSPKPLFGISDFRDVKIGTSTWKDDLYVLTRDFLIIRYPRLTNLQRIKITESKMDTVGFVVTKNYVYIQFKNPQTKESILKVYTLMDSRPYLVYRGPYSSSQSILEVGNYL